MTATGILTLILIAVALYGARRLSVWFFPDAPCRWCKGSGKRWGSDRKRSGPCFFCGGGGKRKRSRKAAKSKR